MNLAVIILAAGESKRLGQPKQLVVFNGTSLLDHAIITAKKAGLKNINVVLGYRSGEMSEAVSDEAVKIIANEGWKEGMSSSIRAGLKAIKSTSSVLIMLCDQPKTGIEHFRMMIAAGNQEKIVCSHYNGINGVPAIFPPKFIPYLKELSGDEGARKIIRQFEDEVISIECPGCAVDVDTPQDLDSLG